MLLDDVFSALDRTTRHQISSRLLGPRGLLRNLGATVLFTTHDSKSDNPKKGAPFSGSLKQISASISKLADEVYEITDFGGLAPVLAQTTSNEAKAASFCEKGSTANSSSPNDENSVTGHAEQAAATVAQEANDDNDELEKPVSDKQVYLRYARAMGFRNAGLFLFLVIAFAVCLKMPGMLNPHLKSSACSCTALLSHLFFPDLGQIFGHNGGPMPLNKVTRVAITTGSGFMHS